MTGACLVQQAEAGLRQRPVVVMPQSEGQAARDSRSRTDGLI